MALVNNIEIKKLEHALDKLPYYASPYSSGMDLFAANLEDMIIGPGEIKIIPTGLCIALPPGIEAQIRPRSGLAARYRLTVLNSPGTIDEDYRGEIKVILINHSNEPFIIVRGLRIAQIVFAQYHRVLGWSVVDELSETERSSGGFGSTGI